MLKKIASENDVFSEKHMEKEIFTPNQLKFRYKVWFSPNTIHENK